jgi:phosphoribosylglycinamide formyltransferase-1
VENIIGYFRDDPRVTVCCVLTNKKDAGVIDRCNNLNVNVFFFNRHAFSDAGGLVSLLECQDPDLIVLAGFLWKIPGIILQKFPDKILNIHPALLPKYGGRGMYGLKVHEAVKDSGDTETGITIHYVNEAYDEGTIIEQVKTTVAGSDTPERIAAKVHELEYEHFPRVIERVLFKGA